MQRVLLIGKNDFDFGKIDNALNYIGCRTVNHKTTLAKLTSVWRPDHTEENAIRYSGLLDHVILSFLIATTSRKMINIVQYVKVEQIDTDEESIVIGICTGTLADWRDLVFKCLKGTQYLNDLGQVLLNELDQLGYSGLFANYNRKIEGKQLRLENKL